MNRIKEIFSNMEKPQKIQFIVAASIALLLLIAGTASAFAWFSATVTGNDTAKGDVVETGSLSIVYTNGQELKGENVLPGWSLSKTFTVENTGTVEATYNINWENLTNTFVNKGDLVYTLTSTNSGGTLTERQIPDSGEHVSILSSIKIAPEVTQTYTLTVSYKNRDADQSSDMGKSLIGKIEVVDVNSTPGKLATAVIEEKATSGNTDGLIKIEQPQTSQTKALTEYRYTGVDVKNYVNFNDEEWRIIGVSEVDDGTGNYEKRIKLIKSTSIGKYAWDTSSEDVNDGMGINQWGANGTYDGADLMKTLNGIYFNSGSGTCYSGCSVTSSSTCDFTTTGLSAEARNMVGDAKWYTAGFDTMLTFDPFTLRYSYTNERGTLVTDNTFDDIARSTSAIGKVGLIYPSDWGYAAGSCSSDPDTPIDYFVDCIDSSWLKDYVGYTLTQCTMAGGTIHYITSEGYIDSNMGVCNGEDIRPSVYLKANVKITDGDGSQNNPYQLSM